MLGDLPSMLCSVLSSHWISLAEYWYRTSFHSALGRTPFEVLYDYPRSHFGIVPSDACAVSDCNSGLMSDPQ